MRLPNKFVFYLSAHEKCTEKLLCQAKTLRARDIEISSDPEVISIRRMVSSVLNEIHRMRSFVRLKPLGPNILYGYMKPRHRIGAYVCDLFALRSKNTIIILGNSTESWVSLCLDQGILRCHGKGLDRTLDEIKSGLNLSERATDGQESIEEIWKVYYSSQYCPERRNISAFHRRMPKKVLDSAGLEVEQNKNGTTLEDFCDL